MTHPTKEKITTIALAMASSLFSLLTVSLLLRANWSRWFVVQDQKHGSSCNIRRVFLSRVICLSFPSHVHNCSCFIKRCCLPLEKKTYGISKTATVIIVVVSCLYIFGPVELFLISQFTAQIMVIVMAIMLIELTVMTYAFLDLFHRRNLRWFVRTAPYIITGTALLCYALFLTIQYAGTKKSNIFLEDNSLANAILSFVTITYFIQVFNERICKKQDNCPDAQTKMMTELSTSVKNAVSQLCQTEKAEIYTLVNHSCLEFSCPTGKLALDGCSSTLGTVKVEGILIYDAEDKQYLGYLLDKRPVVSSRVLLPCINGARYDMTGQVHPDAAPFESGSDTCTVTGYAEQQ